MNDFKLKIKWQVDWSCLLHLLRELAICWLFSFINVNLAIGLALGVNCAWEWQDGLKWQRLPTTTEAFNFADFVAGLIGIFLALVFRGELWLM